MCEEGTFDVSREGSLASRAEPGEQQPPFAHEGPEPSHRGPLEIYRWLGGAENWGRCVGAVGPCVDQHLWLASVFKLGRVGIGKLASLKHTKWGGGL